MNGVVDLGKRVGHGLMLDDLILQSARDQLLTQAAHFKSLGGKLRVHQRQEHKQTHGQRAGDCQFEVNPAALQKCSVKQNGQLSRAYQDTRNGNNGP